MNRIAALAAALGATLVLAGPAAAGPHWNRADMDTSCAPCRDFYRFANGGWLAATKLPAGYTSYGGFEELGDRNEAVLRAILERAAADAGAKPGSDTRRLGDYYAACLDSVQADRAGAAPLAPHLDGIERIASRSALAAQFGLLHAEGIGGGFGFGAAPDARRSAITIAVASQGGLGMPERDYYLKPDSASAALRAEYVAHLERSFRLVGRADARGEAERVMALETALAQASMTRQQRRDPRAVYHKVPLDTLRAWTPGFDWSAYFERRALRAPDSVNVMQPDFFRAFAARAAEAPLADWQAYLRARVIANASPLLSRAFVNEDFAWRRRLTGASELLPRWKRCIAATDGDLGDLLGREFVARTFPPAARERALAMVTRLEDALGERIAVLDWMSDSTKAAARVKLDAFAEKIGYPDKWKAYDGVAISRGSWYANRVACDRWASARNIAKVGRPTDRGEWSMTPPTVNAFYSSAFNSINFPAGILQAPFYDPAWDDALNYGGIGAVIGHEMTHGFDDRGRQFDADGNLRDWWKSADAEHYKARADLVAAQFDGYTVNDSLHVNGRVTLGENIADLGGLAVAYAAFEKAIAGKPRTLVDGFTPEQRFFLSWARVWRTLQTPEDLATQVETDPHSPAAWRVNGPMSNLEEFAKAFGCRGGDAMVRGQEQRARIW
ncbi:MAG: M13 family metallopeptidase [Candidatus Eisenbacteria bacterium]